MNHDVARADHRSGGSDGSSKEPPGWQLACAIRAPFD